MALLLVVEPVAEPAEWPHLAENHGLKRIRLPSPERVGDLSRLQKSILSSSSIISPTMQTDILVLGTGTPAVAQSRIVAHEFPVQVFPLAVPSSTSKTTQTGPRSLSPSLVARRPS